ncbi:MAG: serine/threonine-protein kinase [Akkermansia sp.]
METNSFTLPLGSLIGSYKLLKVLGQGGFGISYLAWDRNLKRNVVIKENFPTGLCFRNLETGGITPLHQEDMPLYQETMNLLMKEAQTLASLNHERIVRVYDVFESGGSIFYVMPLLEGGTLKEILSSNKKISQATIIAWLRDILSALVYLQSQHIVHLDIKPDNILFDEHGHPVLVDFGTAMTLATKDNCEVVAHSSYSAPELFIQGRIPDSRSDLYALAAVFYEIVSGQKVTMSLTRLEQDTFLPLTDQSCVNKWPSYFLKCIDKALSLSPDERFRNAGEWLVLLEMMPEGKDPSSSWKILSILLGLFLMTSITWDVFLRREMAHGQYDRDASSVDIDTLYQEICHENKTEELKTRVTNFENQVNQEIEKNQKDWISRCNDAYTQFQRLETIEEKENAHSALLFWRTSSEYKKIENKMKKRRDEIDPLRNQVYSAHSCLKSTNQTLKTHPELIPLINTKLELDLTPLRDKVCSLHYPIDLYSSKFQEIAQPILNKMNKDMENLRLKRQNGQLSGALGGVHSHACPK